MKKLRLANCYSHFLVIMFFLLAFPLEAAQRNEVYISKEELHEILDNTNLKYVYLDKGFSDLYEVVSRINALEKNKESAIGELKKHIDDGFSIGLQEAVLQSLESAEVTLEENSSQLDGQEIEELNDKLAVVINQIVNDTLTINTKKILSQNEIGEDSMITRCSSNNCNVSSDGCPIMRCCEPIKVVKVRAPLEVFGDARFKKNVQIDGKLKVYGKSTFKDDVKFEDEVKFKDDVVFKEDVLIEGDLTVDGTVTFNGPIQGLTVIDVVIENLSASDIFVENLSVIDANIENLTVTDLVVLSCMDSLCVNNLSAVDEVVSGTLSVNDEIVGDITATMLSATDAVIANLSVTDLAVANCIDNLCVNNLSVGEIVISSCIDAICAESLSVIDLTVSGTASINDAFVENITATTLSATDGVIANLSVTDLAVANCIENLCVENLSVGDITISSCLDSLCVINLSAVDATISGTLSATDIIADNITATTLSATDGVIANLSSTDGVIANLSVTDLAVANCIDELCVLNLSVIDLSAGDIFAGSLSLCDLIVSCDIFMENTNGPAIGNIIKAGNRFIHNAGTDNTFVGINSGNFTTTGAENVGIGRNALFSNTTGFNDTAVGAFSMNTNTIGSNNAAYGSYALVNNTQGNDNVALGNYTLTTNTTGLGNTAIGFQAGYSLATGNNNVFVGNNAGLNLANGLTNIIIGYNSGLSLTAGDNNIYIGNPGVASESGVIRVGTPATHVATFVQGIFGTAVQGTGIAVFVDANGQLGTVVSSARFKHDIQDMAVSSEDIYKLRPVTFIYNNDATDTVQYGLIAEEVDQVLPDLVVHDEEGKPYTVRYHFLPQLLLHELQKLNAVVQDQALTISQLKTDNEQLNSTMAKVLARFDIQA